MNATLRTFLLCLLALLALASPVRAAESINGFRSIMKVLPDGTLRVTEHISVIAEGRLIRHGIFRDFPLLFRKKDGAIGQVGFRVRKVLLDGKPAPWFIRHPTAGVARIFIGDRDAFISHGLHTYTIVYDTWRQIRFFDKRDELVWNVTGSYWAFPIRYARMVVRLPGKAPILASATYTGRPGEKGRDARVLMASDGVFEAETLRPLSPGEGFTIAIAFPKGVVAEPPRWRRLLWRAQDLIGPLWLLAGVGGLSTFFVIAWYRHGRDPAPGAIFPRWEPPADISPAMAHWLKGEAGVKGPEVRRAFIAALVSLAVKGYIEIERKGGLLLLRRKRPSDASLPPGEQLLMRDLFGFSDSFLLGPSNGLRLRRTLREFARTIEEEIERAWLRKNRRHFFIGLVLAALIIVGLAVLAASGHASAKTTLIMAGFLAVPLFLISLLVMELWRKRGWRRWLAVPPVAVALAALGGIVGVVLRNMPNDGLFLPDGWRLAVFLGLLALPAILLAMWHLLPRPTVAGRRMLDALEGLAMFIDVAERPRMNRRQVKKAPGMSPELFEKLLPWAIALGLEKPWSEAFHHWLTNAAVKGAPEALSWQPGWYHGHRDDIFDIDTDTGLVGGLDGGIVNAMPMPSAGTSGFGGGGGGGVGGGGGGGGGGGW